MELNCGLPINRLNLSILDRLVRTGLSVDFMMEPREGPSGERRDGLFIWLSFLTGCLSLTSYVQAFFSCLLGNLILTNIPYTIFLGSQSANKSFTKTHRIGAREGRIHSREFTRCNIDDSQFRKSNKSKRIYLKYK